MDTVRVIALVHRARLGPVATAVQRVEEGLAPGPDLRRLEQAIINEDPSLDVLAVPPPPPAAAPAAASAPPEPPARPTGPSRIRP